MILIYILSKCKKKILLEKILIDQDCKKSVSNNIILIVRWIITLKTLVPIKFNKDRLESKDINNYLLNARIPKNDLIRETIFVVFYFKRNCFNELPLNIGQKIIIILSLGIFIIYILNYISSIRIKLVKKKWLCAYFSLESAEKQLFRNSTCIGSQKLNFFYSKCIKAREKASRIF